MSATRKHLYAPLPATERGKPIHIGGDPKGERFLYCVGKSVVIRNLKNPLESDTYNEHSYNTTVARFAPSGNYIASADVTGKVRIWDTLGDERILKIELPVLGGAVTDLDWSPDNQRIVACGQGREYFGRAFFWDTGSSVGEISGHGKSINSCHMKPNRPFRIATGGEDFLVNFFQGPPFKFNKSHTLHSRFVNCVRFSPTGAHFVSCGQDKKIVLYDGKTGDKIDEFPMEHKGGVYSMSWNAAGTQFLTVSGDKTAKVWDVESKSVVQTYTFGKDVGDQQLGCLWQGDTMITISLNGHINYLDPNNPAQPSRIVRGHNTLVTSIGVDRPNQSFYTASYDGTLVKWNAETGENESFSGQGHRNTVSRLIVSGENVISAGHDDTVRTTNTNSLEFGTSAGLDSPVQFASAAGDKVVAVTMQSINILEGGVAKKRVESAVKPLSCAIKPDGSEIAVGYDNNEVRIFDGELNEKKVITDHRGKVQAMDYSPNGQYLASGDSNREVIVFENGERKVNGWVFHRAAVRCLGWNPAGTHVASGALDQNVIVWNLAEPTKRIIIKDAHQGGVNGVAWLDDNTILSAGQDSATTSWTVTF